MKRLHAHLIGVDQGEELLFSDYETGGDMWISTGPRERRGHVRFSERFRSPPAVHVGMALWDMSVESNIRADVLAENITEEGFDLVFRTWQDSRIARARMNWLAIGELQSEDDWDVP